MLANGQIIQDTVEPSCLPEKLISKHVPLEIRTRNLLVGPGVEPGSSDRLFRSGAHYDYRGRLSDLVFVVFART